MFAKVHNKRKLKGEMMLCPQMFSESYNDKKRELLDTNNKVKKMGRIYLKMKNKNDVSHVPLN